MNGIRKILSFAAFISPALWAAGCAPAPAPPPPGGSAVTPLRGVLVGPIGILSSLFMLAVIALIIVAVWALLRGGVPSAGRREVHRLSSAKEIARERYARGEISREEYWQLIRDLEDSRRAQPAQ